VPIKFVAVFALAITISAECLAQSPAQPNQTQTASEKVDALRVDLQTAKDGLLNDFKTLSDESISYKPFRNEQPNSNGTLNGTCGCWSSPHALSNRR